MAGGLLGERESGMRVPHMTWALNGPADQRCFDRVGVPLSQPTRDRLPEGLWGLGRLTEPDPPLTGLPVVVMARAPSRDVGAAQAHDGVRAT